jgi:anhydro-N-acetylmuramic acid kinase
MSGTSMDAIDTALVSIESGSIDLLAYQQFPISDQVRSAVRNLSAASPLDEVMHMDVVLGHLFADAVLKIIEQTGNNAQDIRAVGSHGQTVLHHPDSPEPRTLQIGDANIIAYRTGIPTVADFRRADMAAGGQGAPLAPALHAHFFRSATGDRVVLNIGGIANITLLPAATDIEVTGFDTGPGNGLLDDWNRRHRGTAMDENGAWAASGRVDKPLLNLLLADPYFSKAPPKSTGRDYFNLEWLDGLLGKYTQAPEPEHVQATLVMLTARNIADAIKLHAGSSREIYICGGGMHNTHLIQTLETCLPEATIATTDSLGIPPDAVEAVTFAWLGHCRLEGIPGNLPSVTGAETPVMLGAVHEKVKK